MQPEEYDTWYDTPRGAWIGEEEYRLLQSLLEARAGEMLLDVGCGTGYFIRRFTSDAVDRNVAGADIDFDTIRFAAGHSARGIGFVAADARRLPFHDRSFDLVVSVTALCFIREEKQALPPIILRGYYVQVFARRILHPPPEAGYLGDSGAGNAVSHPVSAYQD